MTVFRSAKTRSDHQRTPRPFVGALGMAIRLALAIPSLAQALSFQVDFRNSTYQVQGTDNYASLLAQHQSESLIATNTLDTLQGISAPTTAC